VGLSSPEQWRRVAFADGLVNDSGWGGLTTAETKQFLADKNLNLQTSFDLVGRYLGGSFDEEASLDFFEALYALLAEPKIDVSTLEEYLQKIPEQISAQEREYTTPFSQAIRRVFYGNNPYNWDLKDLSLKDITREESLAFYQAQFSGLQEFPFVFVGDLKIDVLKDLTARFLGTIPLTPSQASRRDFTPYAEGDKREVVSNDPEQRVTVLMAFTDNRVPNPFRDLEESRLFLRALELAYERILIEQVREAISGVYGISFRLLPQRQQDKSVFKNRAQVSFVTSPVQLDQVREAVIRTLRAGQERGFSEETVDYVYKNLQKNYRESYRENGYWVAYILQELLYQGTLEHKPVEFYLDALSSARLQALSRQLISLDAMKEVILLPKGQT
jgi:predicted Zn-dependent peptidase